MLTADEAGKPGPRKEILIKDIDGLALRVAADAAKENGFGVVDPTALTIDKLGYPRFMGNRNWKNDAGQTDRLTGEEARLGALAKELPHFRAWVPAGHYQGRDHTREVLVFEAAALLETFRFIGVGKPAKYVARFHGPKEAARRRQAGRVEKLQDWYEVAPAEYMVGMSRHLGVRVGHLANPDGPQLPAVYEPAHPWVAGCIALAWREDYSGDFDNPSRGDVRFVEFFRNEAEAKGRWSALWTDQAGGFDVGDFYLWVERLSQYPERRTVVLGERPKFCEWGAS